jgi:methylase of polypeptide subunit release factors
MSAAEIDFGGLSIRYDERVLEPRPWTTSQSRWAADLLRDSPPGPVLELCSGAGHIGLLAVAFQPRDLVMVDVNPVACTYARENVERNPVTTAVEVREGSMDEVLDAHERFAAVIADPPWVTSNEVTRFPGDPVIAIDGGPDGMAVAWLCLDVIERHLVDQGWALLQLGNTAQAGALEEHLAVSPDHRLEVKEVREYDARGVLVLLTRPRQD